VDGDARIARAGGGSTWLDFDVASQAHGLVTPGGVVGSTGVCGLTLGGGIGHLTAQLGLTCDQLVGAELVTPAGTIVQVGPDAEPELLWGLRGGGGNFGVVTRFTFSLNPLPVPMFAGLVLHPLSRARDCLRVLLDLAAVVPDGLGLNAAMITAPPAPFVPVDLQGRPVIAVAAAYLGDADEGAELVRSLRTFTPPAVDLFGPTPYSVLQSMFDDGPPRIADVRRVRTDWTWGSLPTSRSPWPFEGCNLSRGPTWRTVSRR
jgi:FAD/FMN-containing dehydrogenase